ncbi:MAG: hypothetical protein G3M78_15360, partial [Candidatus Nitrohelix vancouverensis]
APIEERDVLKEEEAVIVSVEQTEPAPIEERDVLKEEEAVIVSAKQAKPAEPAEPVEAEATEEVESVVRPRVSPVPPQAMVLAEKPAAPKAVISSEIKLQTVIRGLIPRSAPGIEAPVLKGDSYGPVKWGETLTRIAAGLAEDPGDARRLAVALWMDNRDQFLYGNMNGLKVGATLQVDAVEERLSTIDERAAMQIFSRQWEEWRGIRVEKKAKPQVSIPIELPRILFQEAEGPALVAMFELLELWRVSWEKADGATHLPFFSREVPPQLIGYKERLMKLHGPAKIETGDVLLVPIVRGWRAVFRQAFASQRLESIGVKELDLTVEDGRWKISDERFRVEKSRVLKKETPSGWLEANFETSLKIPYTAHLSSHPYWEDAVIEVTRLRKAGVQAHVAPYHFAKDQKIFRIFSGRFADWDSANDWVDALKKSGVVENAAPWQMPYALSLGVHKNIDDAEEWVHRLAQKKISAYYYGQTENNFSNPAWHVLTGMYATEKETTAGRKELQDQGFEAVVTGF